MQTTLLLLDLHRTFQHSAANILGTLGICPLFPEISTRGAPGARLAIVKLA